MSLTSYRAAPSRDTFVGLWLTLFEAGFLAYCLFGSFRPGSCSIIVREKFDLGIFLGLAVTYSPGA